MTLPLSLLVYGAVIVALYFRAVSGPLIFDDYEIPPRMVKYRGRWNWKFPLKMWRQQRPLAWGSWAAQTIFDQNGGVNPATFRRWHRGNLALHLVNSVLVERIAEASGFGFPELAGLVFAAHPLATNAAAWMAGRASLLAGCFGLLAVLAVLAGYGLLAIPALAASFLSKEDGVGYGVAVAALLVVRGEGWTLALAAAVGLVAGLRYRGMARAILAGSGERHMAKVGLPGGRPQPQHGLLVLWATLSRLPFWAVGLRQSPYHGSGVRWW